MYRVHFVFPHIKYLRIRYEHWTILSPSRVPAGDFDVAPDWQALGGLVLNKAPLRKR